METGSEFSIVTHNGDGPDTLTVLTFAQLLAFDRELRANGGPPTARHQDFLRALGRELDNLLASNILFEELEEGLLLTYFIQPPENRHMWRKQRAMLDRDDQSMLLKKAVARRVQVERGRWGLKKQWKR